MPQKWMDGFRFAFLLALRFNEYLEVSRRGLERSAQSRLKTNRSRLWPPGVSQLQEEGAGRITPTRQRFTLDDEGATGERRLSRIR
jgi:hypothetical protein